jgi:hypothetical protein
MGAITLGHSISPVICEVTLTLSKLLRWSYAFEGDGTRDEGPEWVSPGAEMVALIRAFGVFYSAMPKPRPKITRTRPTKEVSVMAWIGRGAKGAIGAAGCGIEALDSSGRQGEAR